MPRWLGNRTVEVLNSHPLPGHRVWWTGEVWICTDRGCQWETNNDREARAAYLRRNPEHGGSLEEYFG